MTFSRIKPLGWNTGDVLTEDEINDLDIDHANALDAGAGGLHEPSSVIEIGGAGLEMSGPFTASDTADFSGIATFDDFVVVNGLSTFTAPAVFTDDVQLGDSDADTISLRSPLQFSGRGRVPKRISPGADADGSYGPKDWDIVHRSAGLAANRTYTIDDTGAQDGDHMVFSLNSGPEKIIVRDPAAVLLQELEVGAIEWVVVIRRSGSWVRLMNGAVT